MTAAILNFMNCHISATAKNAVVIKFYMLTDNASHSEIYGSSIIMKMQDVGLQIIRLKSTKLNISATMLFG